MQGRANSLDTLTSYALLPLGVVIVGVLTDRFGAPIIFVCGAILSSLFFLAALAVPDVRHFD